MRAFKSWLDASNNTVIRLLPFPISLLKLGISKRGCGHADPNSFAALFPDQGLKDSGRANLNSLTGGLAYGIPRYSYTDLPFGSVSSLPTIVPDVVFTSGSLPLTWYRRGLFNFVKKKALKNGQRQVTTILTDRSLDPGDSWR